MEEGTDEDQAEEDMERGTELEEPTKNEYYDTIENLKHEKAAGQDDICNEMIKYGGEERRGDQFREIIYELIKHIWR